MTVWLYCICRNERQIIPYFLRHYVPWVNKLIFYDDQSDDGTREIIARTPNCELRDWPGSHGMVDDEFLSFANEQWKEARGQATWIIWADADEFFYHPNMLELLAHYAAHNVEVPRVQGYTMFSKQFPTTEGQIYDEIRTGIPDGFWDKHGIFRVNMFWTMGRHGLDFSRFKPNSTVNADIKLLHYRGLGMDYVRWRHARNWERMPLHCRQMGLGDNTNPEYVGHHSVAWFEEIMNLELPNVI